MLQSLTNLIDFVCQNWKIHLKKYSVTKIKKSDKTKMKEITILEKEKKNVY